MSACPFCQETLPTSYKPISGVQLCACQRCYNPFLLEWQGANPVARALDNSVDIRQTAPPGSIGALILEKLPEAMENLPVFPEISQKVLKMVRDPDVSMADLAKIIRQEQVIALSIMHLANSAMYGGLQEVKDLNTACSRLGMRTIANTVQVVVNGKLFISADKRIHDFIKRLWRHSIAVAHCSAEIASLISEPGGETLFLAGLIHDIGKVVLLEIISHSKSTIIADIRNTPDFLREVLDGFHALVGLHVVQRWNLPAEFRAIIYAHHDPQLCSNEAWMAMAHTICLADRIAHIEGYGTDDEQENAFLVSHPSARYLNLSDIKLAALRVDLADKLEALMEASGAV